jgi:hypothetical protein
VKELWGQLLVDACIGSNRMLGESRLSLLSVRRTGTGALELKIGIPTDQLTVTVNRGLGEFSNVVAASSTIKAILTVDGKVADRIMDTVSYGTSSVDIGIPFDLRCTSGAQNRVESITACTPPAGHECESPMFSESDAPAKTITGGDVVLVAKDGIDIEATELLPLTGRVLRLSAIAAPENASADDKGINIMIRGDDCFTVETIPGAKAAGGAPIKRTADDPDGNGMLGGGVIKVSTVCKPCCQCEDYKAAVDALKAPEERMYHVEQILNDAKQVYDEAVEALNGLQEDAIDAINSIDNIMVHAVASLSPSGYGSVDTKGKRSRLSVTVYVENMTLETATVASVSFTVGTVADGFSLVSGTTTWTRVSGGTTYSGTGLPVSSVLAPGGTLAVTATYAKTSTTNSVSRPATMTATARVAVGTGAAQNKTVNVT